MNYLGVPIGPGRRKIQYYLPLIERIKARLQGWQCKLLSPAGRIILIKHVLSSMPIHLLSATAIPKSVFNIIETLFANFFWGSSEYGKKKHWLRWHKLCLPVAEGGLGFHKLADVKQAFILKQCWRISTLLSIWTDFMKTKYQLGVSSLFWNGPQRCSVEFKNILGMKQVFASLCSWTIGKGNVSFWYDRWHPEFLLDLLNPHGDIQLKLKDFHDNGTWLFDDLIPSLGPDVVQSLYLNAPRLTENDDK